MLNGLGRYRVPRGKPQSHEDARKQLEKDIVRQFADLPLVSVHLVWDGAEKSQHNLGSNVLVHFSGGTGEHRADKYIINQMEFFKRASDIPMVLVTADNGFAGDARKCGAEVCSLHDFEAFLNVRS
jgi:type VI protein secretion system component VasF